MKNLSPWGGPISYSLLSSSARSRGCGSEPVGRKGQRSLLLWKVVTSSPPPAEPKLCQMQCCAVQNNLTFFPQLTSFPSKRLQPPPATSDGFLLILSTGPGSYHGKSSRSFPFFLVAHPEQSSTNPSSLLGLFFFTSCAVFCVFTSFTTEPRAGGMGQLLIEPFALKRVRNPRVCSESELEIWSRCWFYRGERGEEKTPLPSPACVLAFSEVSSACGGGGKLLAVCKKRQGL